jgi:hypothetical protein
LLARFLLPKADLVTAVDPVVADEAARLGAHNVQVMPHFVCDTPPSPADLPGNGINLVHAGSLSLSDPEANIADLLRPFETARARNPDLRLHLVGRLTGMEVAEAGASPAREAIHVLGVRPLEEALQLMAGADGLIFVASAKMHVPPSKIVDYLMFQAPIIACGAGPWRRDPRVPADDPVEAMARLRKGDRRVSSFKPPTASETASRLLALMSEAGE